MDKKILYITGAIIIFSAVIFLLQMKRIFQRSAAIVPLEQASQKIDSPSSASIETNDDLVGLVNKEKITLTFTGDFMFDRYIRQVAAKKGNEYILKEISATFRDSDAVIANLEGPLTDKPSVSEASKEGEPLNYVFTFDPKVAATLKEHNIGIVNLGNNHILNMEVSGLEQTLDNLNQSDIEYFGDVRTNSEKVNSQLSQYLVREISGVKIALVSFNQFFGKGKNEALAKVQAARRESDIVVVCPHWGIEYSATPEEAVKKLSHDFIDAGADVVIGTHPHVVQPKEEYRGKIIYYSLGNFVFDQYFSKETKEGLLVKVTIDTATKNFNFEEIPIELKNNGQTVLKK